MSKVICDIGSNHNQSLDRAIDLIDCAKECGAFGIKFQYFETEKLYHPSTDIDFDELKRRELPKEWIPELCGYAKSIGLAFGLTFFNTGIMSEFKDCHFDFIKISSFDTLRDDLIREALICTDKRLIISTGLMDLAEIFILNEKIAAWENSLSIPHKELTFMHCVSEYPAKDGHMGFMRKMVQEGYRVGYSDHTVVPRYIATASILGAEYIEVHLDLKDCAGYENIGHCWKPKDLKLIIEDINALELDMTNKEIKEESLKNQADPSDGIRPLKRWREDK